MAQTSKQLKDQLQSSPHVTERPTYAILQHLRPTATIDEVYAQNLLTGRSAWVQLTSAQTAAQQATAIQAVIG